MSVVIGKEVTKKVDLATAGAWVLLLTNPPKDAFVANPQDTGDTSDSNLFLKIIKDWNFVEDDGVTKAAITKENIDKALSRFDIMRISESLGLTEVFLSAGKKNS
jgi:hypothetical protein